MCFLKPFKNYHNLPRIFAYSNDLSDDGQNYRISIFFNKKEILKEKTDRLTLRQGLMKFTVHTMPLH